MSTRIVPYHHKTHFQEVRELVLRLSDQEELEASSELPPHCTLLQSLAVSEEVFAMTSQDILIGLFGVAPSFDEVDVGVPWLLGSDKLDDLNMTFVKEGRKYARKWLKRYKRLENFTHYAHEKAHKWIEYLGFTVCDEYVYLHDPHEPFLYFFKENT